MSESKKQLLIIGDDPAYIDELKEVLTKDIDNFNIKTTRPTLNALDTIYGYPPDIIIIIQSSDTDEWENLCRKIKSDTVFGHLPIILILQPKNNIIIDLEKIPVDDYLLKPFTPSGIQSRISLSLARTMRMRDANPLTQLPGNHSITKELQSRIDKKINFSVAYVDLDNFKSYNDKYGFLRGDEIIKMTARLITNSVRHINISEAFVGHVGGDDFVFIVPPEKMDGVCKRIIKDFDLIVGNFYDDEDRMRGYINSVNRNGDKEQFPIMSLSFAIVSNEYKAIDHIGQISEIAAGVKKRVKSMQGSNYLKDMRGSKDT